MQLGRSKKQETLVVILEARDFSRVRFTFISLLLVVILVVGVLVGCGGSEDSSTNLNVRNEIQQDLSFYISTLKEARDNNDMTNKTTIGKLFEIHNKYENLNDDEIYIIGEVMDLGNMYVEWEILNLTEKESNVANAKLSKFDNKIQEISKIFKIK